MNSNSMMKFPIAYNYNEPKLITYICFAFYIKGQVCPLKIYRSAGGTRYFLFV